jgi:putative membrane protein
MVSNRGSVVALLLWQWRAVVLFAASGTAITIAKKFYGMQLTMPTMPLAVVGAALGIFVSFRTNSAYARWWEGRQLWGRLVNNSRHFATQVLTYMRASEGVDLPAAQRDLIERHLAYVHALRCAVRKQDVLADASVKRLLPEAVRARLASERNLPYAILQDQAAHLADLAAQGALDELRLQSIDRTVANLLDVQGGCERIKNTPMPRGYGFIAERLICAYACLLPFALVNDLGWLTIPINVLVCLSFALIGEAGRVLEDPFDMFWNGLPLSALATTIEINLRQRLGDRDIPPDPKPNDRGILM